MAIKKSELYSSLWKSCDELRGGMDASQYKDYILVLLFVKYVSDKYAGVADAPIEVPAEGGFQDIVSLKGNKDIGDGINKVIAKLAEANDLVGIITVADFNDGDKLGKGKEMQDRLTQLVGIFQNPALNFSRNRADGDDILGDAYEYLMRNFATQSGKSKGQFYTPAEVSRVISQVIGVNAAQSQDQTIYDPTCGSGSLLLKAADEAERGLTIYGQEMDNATRALARMNMILHGHPTAEIWQDNTLSSPYFKNADGSLKTFDFAVANPPFSAKAWSNGLNPQQDEFDRFEGFGIPPAKNGDYAFLLHITRSLKSQGKGAIILPHGVLFRGNAEADIRRNLILKGIIKGIIGLPPNLFYGTGIPACIIVLDKENADNRQGIFIIDASKGFVKDGNKNRLREQDIHKIVDVFNKQLEVPKYSRLVSVEEIASNDYNLNIPRYIDSQEEEDIQDIEAHLLGGIPQRDVEALGEYWQVYPTLQQELFEPANRPGYQMLKVTSGDVKACIFAHPEFISYGKDIEAVFETWKNQHVGLLKGIKQGDKPKEIIYQLAENLLLGFTGKSLIDKYDVYQHLMTYWLESMKDDVYILVEDGWKAELKEVVNKNGKLTDYECELIPKELIINRYFQAEEAYIETQKDDIVRQIEELREEHGGEDGLLEELTNDKGKITKGNVESRIKVIKKDPNFVDDLQVLTVYLRLIEREAEVNRKIKELNNKVIKKYSQLTDDDIKTLVVDDKWLLTLQQAINSEMERISQRLTQRIKQLAERYEMPLPELDKEVEELTAKVEGHLKRMGLGAMQQLLTGKMRLPSFSGEWRNEILGKECELITKGTTPTSLGKNFKKNGITFIKIESLEENGKIIRDKVAFIDEETHLLLRRSQLKENDILISIAGALGRIAIINKEILPANTNQALAIVRLKSGTEINRNYLFYFLNSSNIKKYIDAINVQAAQANLSLENINDFIITFPPLPEQKAIAQILSDMDAEIAALEKKRDKYKAIKQGMMQELLTGKTRLIER